MKISEGCEFCAHGELTDFFDQCPNCGCWLDDEEDFEDDLDEDNEEESIPCEG